MRWLLALLLIVIGTAGAEAVDEDKAERALQISRSALGNTLPDIQLTKTYGETIRLSDYRGKPLYCHPITLR